MKSHFPKTREMETTLNSKVAKTEKITLFVSRFVYVFDWSALKVTFGKLLLLLIQKIIIVNTTVIMNR